MMDLHIHSAFLCSIPPLFFASLRASLSDDVIPFLLGGGGGGRERGVEISRIGNDY